MLATSPTQCQNAADVGALVGARTLDNKNPTNSSYDNNRPSAITMAQTAPGRYQAEFPTPLAGSYHLEFSQKYQGKPLYLFKKDVKPGDRNGDNFKDVWHVVKE